MSSGQDELFHRGGVMMEKMRLHDDLDGGITAGIFGSKGSGKTTLLLTLVQKMYYYNEKTKSFERETIVWRGRGTDYWNWFARGWVVLHIHKNDNNTEYGRTMKWHTDKDKNINVEDLPEIRYYEDCADLYKSLEKGKINVVYEPQDYFFKESLKRMIKEKSLANEDIFKNIVRMDPCIFWFEFLDYLVTKRTKRDFVSVIIDEADDVVPNTPSGLRWHLNIWFRERLRDLRKWNISLFMATHGTTDLDGRIFKKFMQFIYLKGCVAPQNSLIKPRTRPLLLASGHGYIEGGGDGYGMFRYDRIKQQPRVIIEYEETEALKLKLREMCEVKRGRGRPRKITPVIAEKMQEKRKDIDTAMDKIKDDDDFGLIIDDVEGIE